ncbi:hypothetical protein DWW55_04675 [Paraprevotella clara]|nr:hypothetical protein DWW55_04675 [Paraprevotella clara]
MFFRHYATKIVKGECRDKRKTKFFKFGYAEPYLIFEETKIVKGGILRIQNRLNFCAPNDFSFSGD